MNKAFITFLALILISNLLIAQENKEKKNSGKIGLTFSSFGDIDIVQDEGLIGGPGYIGGNFYKFGFNYLKPIYKFLDFETGFEYSNYNFTITPAPNPNIEYTTESTNISLISIPIELRLNFLKFFFINGGIMLDMDMSTYNNINSQSGIGTNIGLGLKYDFKFGLSAFVNPYFKAHSMISFSFNDNHQKLYETGYRIGVMYQLNKITLKK